MKKLLFFVAIALVSLQLFGQTSGGPDAYGYTWKNSNHTTNPPVFSWFDISTIGYEVIGLADDNVVGPFNASSGFQFYWYPAPQFWVGSNGYISFTGDNIASPFPTTIPLSSGANNWIAPLLSDLNFSGTSNPGHVYIYSNTDTLCVSYVNVPYWVNANPAYTGSNTFQIMISKSDKSITFNYLSLNMGTQTTLDNIIGIENNTGTLGLPAMIDALPADSFSIKFYYPDTVTYAVTDGGISWNNNDANGGVFIKKGGPPYVLKANLKNYGNQVLGSFTVKDTVYLANNAVLTSGTATVPPLLMGNDTVITFSNTLTASFAGTYKFNTRLSGITGDMVASNNYLQQEIVAVDTTLNTMLLEYSDYGYESGLGWNGGNGGIAIYIEPPVYPAKIVSSRFFISANNATLPVGFYAKIFDDDGLNGSAGTLLDSVFVPGSTITNLQYKVVPCANNNIIIPSGGVYLLWYMEAADINLGRDITPPISRRTYEVLSGGWADYRDKLTEDFLLGINIQKVVVAPLADYSYDATADPQISFTDLSTNSPGSWLWDFDDGTTSTQKNPVHLYASNGSYHVCLTSTNSGGSDSICKTITISNAILAPVALFSIDSSSMPSISFTDISANSPTSWLWDFDDTGDDTATVQNPLYAFKTNGIHNVCLTATNTAGSSLPYCYNLFVHGVGIGIDEYSNKTSLIVYPNPVNQNAIIQIRSTEILKNVQLKVFNILGEEVITEYDINKNVIELKCKDLEKGTYFFDIYNEKDILGKGKFIVQ